MHFYSLWINMVAWIRWKCYFKTYIMGLFDKYTFKYFFGVCRRRLKNHDQNDIYIYIDKWWMNLYYCSHWKCSTMKLNSLVKWKLRAKCVRFWRCFYSCLSLSFVHNNKRIGQKSYTKWIFKRNWMDIIVYSMKFDCSTSHIVE